MICLLSACDIAKIEMLRSNIKYIGMVYCFLVFFQMMAYSVLFENVIQFLLNVTKQDQLKMCIALELCCDLICIALLVEPLKKEY